MRRSDGTGSESNVKTSDVGEEGNKGSLEEESEVGEGVSHGLLGEGKIPGSADKEIGPLDAHNRDKISTLSVLEGFSGVANLVSADEGDPEELGNALINRIPSAR